MHTFNRVNSPNQELERQGGGRVEKGIVFFFGGFQLDQEASDFQHDWLV